MLLTKNLNRLARQEFRGYIERYSWHKKQIENYQLKRLRALLAYAKEHSSWYKKSLAHINANSFLLENLYEIPIITKEIFMTHWNEIVTDKNITLDLAKNIISGKQDNITPYRITRSGGTSGFTGIYLFNHYAWASSFNSITRFLHHESTIQRGVREKITRITIAAPFSNHMTSALMVDPNSLVEEIYIPVTKPYDEIISKLKNYSPDILQGFPSILSRLAYSKQCGEINIAPKMLISMAEPLEESVRQLLIKTWNVKVYDIWAVGEFGPLAVTCKDCNHLILNEDHCIIEYNKNTPNQSVFVTGLHNKIMPLIRYQIDDIIHPTVNNEHLKTGFSMIQGIAGRPTDQFRYDDIVIHGYCFRQVFLYFPEITDYQLLQTQRGVRLCLALAMNITEATIEKLKNSLMMQLKTQNIKEPEVIIDFVPDFIRTPAGKVLRLIPMVKK